MAVVDGGSNSHNTFGFLHTWPSTRIGATVDGHFAILESTCQLSVGEEVDWIGDDWPNGSRVAITEYQPHEASCERVATD